MGYHVCYSGELMITSAAVSQDKWDAFTAEDEELSHPYHANFDLQEKKVGWFTLTIEEENKPFPLSDTVRKIMDWVKDLDSSAVVSGTIHYTGDDEEDAGYLTIKDDVIKDFVKYICYVENSEYDTVDKLVKRYLESDLKEFIQEGIK